VYFCSLGLPFYFTPDIFAPLTIVPSKATHVPPNCSLLSFGQRLRMFSPAELRQRLSLPISIRFDNLVACRNTSLYQAYWLQLIALPAPLAMKTSCSVRVGMPMLESIANEPQQLRSRLNGEWPEFKIERMELRWPDASCPSINGVNNYFSI